MQNKKTTGDHVATIIGYIIGIALVGWYLDWALDHLVEKEFYYWQSCLAVLAWTVFVPRSARWILGLSLVVSTFYIWFF